MPANRQEQMKEITERLEQGVKELFTSEQYTEYLKAMSKFHHYSFNNTILIAMQKPDASLIAGYQAWQKKFNRHVKRGEKGIQIIAPAPVKEQEEREKIDEKTGEVVLKPDGQPETEVVEYVVPRFRVTTVFDVSQTDGEPIPDLEVNELTDTVNDFDAFMQAIRATSPVPIRFDEIESGAKGYYHNLDKEIVIQNGMSESQTMKTAIHEVTHAMLHDRDMMEELGEKKDQLTREVEAESVAFTVCQHFGLDTSDYSFPYIASWSSDMDMKELRTSMDTIRKTAGEFIDKMEEQLQELRTQEQEKTHLEKDDLILKISGSMGSEYSYSVVQNMGKAELLVQLRSYEELYGESGEVELEDFLEGQGAKLIPWYASNGYIVENPVNFYDVEYDYDTGVTDVEELPAMGLAAMLINRAEYEKTIFSDEDRNLIVNYAFKLDNIENTKTLIEKLATALEESDTHTAIDVRREAQAEIDVLPDPMIGLSEMHRYGYRDNDMLPLTKEKALEMHRIGEKVYCLNADGSKSDFASREEIENFDGIFGIRTEVWERLRTQEVDFLEDDPYGYPPMAILNKDDALKYFDAGEMIFLVTSNRYLTAVDERAEIERGSDTFQMGRDELAEIRRIEAEMSEHPEISSLREAKLRLGTEERYGIYQIRDDSPGRNFEFMSLDFAQSHGYTVNKNDYELVYADKLYPAETLDTLYEKFNINHPADFRGHSLSVSDVVVMNRGGEVKAFYVDSVTFQELPDFYKQLEEQERNITVTEQTSGLAVDGHFGTWHTIDAIEVQGETFFLMEHDEYGDEAACIAVNAEGRLVAEDLFNGFDEGFHEALTEYFAEKGVTYMYEAQEQKPSQEVYRSSRAYAQEHNEIPAFRDSHRLNRDCKEAIEAAIRENFDGMHLKHDVVRPVIEEFGADRVAFVLANTLQHKDWDGRFSVANKEWASEIIIPDNTAMGMDLNTEFVVESHPAVLDGFVNLFRKEENLLAQEAEKPFVDHYYVVEDLAKQGSLVVQEFDNLDEAMEKYFVLPNHQKKALGVQNTNPLPGSLDFIQCKNGIDTVIEDYKKVEGWDNPEIQQIAEKVEQTIENHDSVIAYELNDRYLRIQTTEDGYDYTFYDKQFAEIDGGVYDDYSLTMGEALEAILADENLSAEQCQVIDCDKFLEDVEAAEFPQSKDKEIELYDGVAFKMGYGYFTVQKVEEGYDYVVYDADRKEIDGGVWEDPDISIYQAAKCIYKDVMGDSPKLESVDYQAFVDDTLQKSKERLGEDRITPTSEIGRRELSLHGASRAEIEETALCYAQSIIDDMGLSDEVQLIGARVYGSRSREGLYKSESDIDVVLSYTGNIREDAFFNALHEDGMEIAGMPLDVNPVSAERTATLGEYMKQAEAYLDEKEAKVLAADIDRFAYDLDTYGYRDAVDDPEQNVAKVTSDLLNGKAQYLKDWLQEVVDEVDLPESVEEAKKLIARMDALGMAEAQPVNEKTEMAQDAKITFYVAECSEFPVLGEFHENLTLDEAVDLFQQIPAERLNGIKSIGFCLEDGSIYDGNYDLYRGNSVMSDDINEIQHYRESPLVQKAIADMEHIAQTVFHQEVRAAEPERTPEPVQTEKEPVTQPKVKEPAQAPVQSGKKESVLKSLRERQAKIKEQEKTAPKQKEQSKKKGEQEL